MPSLAVLMKAGPGVALMRHFSTFFRWDQGMGVRVPAEHRKDFIVCLSGTESRIEYCSSRSKRLVAQLVVVIRGARAPVAQLDRASVYGTEGRKFESFRARRGGQ